MWTTKLSSNRLCGIPTVAGGSETTYNADGYYNPELVPVFLVLSVWALSAVVAVKAQRACLVTTRPVITLWTGPRSSAKRTKSGR